ncbi:MAG: hypothetical protein D6770_02400 [Anaerolineae bacterium]|nr:MAG: hypothetical protein D6770_02400 [Anaerolineae bacterium]
MWQGKQILRQVLLLGGVFLLILLVMDFNARLENLNRLERSLKTVRAEATQASQTQVALQTAIAYATSEQAVEEWAREEAGYIQPGDQPVVPLPVPGSTPTATPVPTVTLTPVENWQVWWELFFGE